MKMLLAFLVENGGNNMGIIYNDNVEESKIYEAYGLTVYGKINRYVWTIRGGEDENALITFRITDADENNIFSMNMGNNCIFQSRIDDTLDNFLWWIAEEYPDAYTIEKQVFKSLCFSDCLFNHSIRNRKFKKRKEEEERKRIAEYKEKEQADINNIKAYCNKNGFLFYFTSNGVYIIKAFTDNATYLLKTAGDDRLKSLIDFIEQYPNNEDAKIIKNGTIEEILEYIRRNGGK